MLPHLPWEHLPSGSRYNDRREVPGLVREDFWGPDEGLVAAAYYRLLLQTQALDALTGELFERLRDLGVFEEAMVILTSDHGASFRPDASRR
ncbi:MAG: alkaline phosphatase family protein, partial [Acidobacteriota bacterium]|nr:alkaline phosphatase family protein [Acidobacteriota bacterium]